MGDAGLRPERAAHTGLLRRTVLQAAPAVRAARKGRFRRPLPRRSTWHGKNSTPNPVIGQASPIIGVARFACVIPCGRAAKRTGVRRWPGVVPNRTRTPSRCRPRRCRATPDRTRPPRSPLTGHTGGSLLAAGRKPPDAARTSGSCTVARMHSEPHLPLSGVWKRGSVEWHTGGAVRTMARYRRAGCWPWPMTWRARPARPGAPWRREAAPSAVRKPGEPGGRPRQALSGAAHASRLAAGRGQQPSHLAVSQR